MTQNQVLYFITPKNKIAVEDLQMRLLLSIINLFKKHLALDVRMSVISSFGNIRKSI